MLSALSSGEWLTSRRMTFAAAGMLIGTLVSLGFLFATATGTADALGRPLGTDFTSFWSAGRMVIEGRAAAAYDWAAHNAVQWQTHHTDGYFPFSYPPLLFLVMAPIAMLAYVPALVVWQSLSLAAALAAVRAILPEKHFMLLALGFPGVLVCLGHGQTGFLTAALFAGGLVALARHEIVAGLLFGLMAYKPQFGLVIPFALAAGGHWRAFAAAAVTVVSTVALTLLLWGPSVWQAFWTALPQTGAVVLEAHHFEKLQSAFACVRLWGGPVWLAYGGQAVVAAGVVAATVMAWRAEVPIRLKAALLLTGAMLATPYVVDYDFVLLGMAAAFFAAHCVERGFLPWEKTLLAAAWLVPLVARTAAREVYLPVGLMVLAAMFAVLMRRVRADAGRDVGLALAAF
ncbi:glycosyltransferase family 87 protein [Xanthobacteraceae bacterium Astr-EGSB]|uniref:glycosyltransferase family 87 protein n=1 Tax=Astrobacterium formosum TaxID=3069710 RepID=UPI0027B4036E|nr:glycosyltransferase family 87 protein [Xanthobacteraceae bacterium Astr-EGSB]